MSNFATESLGTSPSGALCGEMEKLLTRFDLARLLNCSVRNIDLFRENGLPSLKLGHLVRFRYNDVVQWLEAHRVVK